MADFEGSKTMKNLAKAFAGESQARNRYTFYASRAGKEGYRQIEAIFLETADNERIHANRFFKALTGKRGAPGVVEIEAGYPFSIGTTLENLKAAAAGENEEHTTLYPGFADEAEAEGYNDVAAIFRMIARVEVEHEKRYLALVSNIEGNKVFEKASPVRWHCRKCGYVHEGTTAPERCPACAHGKEYFEVLAENY